LEGYLKKLAAIGMTILVSSGDSGASGDSEGCISLVSSWPAVSPWVTSVGGTQLLGLGEDLETKEVSCSSSTNGGPTSGGGFSGTWLNASTPSWQQKAVSKYLEENNATTFTGFPTLKTPYYNPGGRGFPDIAAYAAFIPILGPSGNMLPVSGTSLSAPLMASLFTLANQKLLRDGYSLIGYANPMLYWMAENCPEVFNDITIGNNQSGENGYLCQYGYPAAVGWDPVTGLGSINFNPFVECIKVYQDLKT
jgi:tripeptidyl-peptidase-1